MDIFYVYFVSIFGLICSDSIGFASANRVLLRDVTSLTLRRGHFTSGRRSSPVPQLECVGGTAYGKFAPKVVQCYNRGWDGRDVQWECKAEMSKDFQFGNIEVTCEGFDYPNDPYILAGSCGLRYELDFSSSGAKRQPFGEHFVSLPSGWPWFKFENIIHILVILFVLYLLYLMFWPTAGGADRRPGGGGGGGGGGYPPNDRPPPPGWNNPPPPSYDDSCGLGSSGRPTNDSAGRPGFFSGLGLGALGGYLFGRNSGSYGEDYRRRRPYRTYYDGYGGGGYDGSAPSTSSSSSSTHTSSGFGGTSRR